MRLPINLLKTLFYAAFLAVAAVWLAMVAMSHYQGEVASLELLNLETAPVRLDPFIGWLFEAVTPGANLINWVAASMTLGIVILGWLATHHLIAIIRLAADARIYINRNEGPDLLRALAVHAISLVLTCIPLIVLLNADASLFQHRGLAAHLGVDDPAEAARTVPSMGAMPRDSLNNGSVAFFAGPGWLMSITLGVAPAIAMELIGTRLLQALTLVTEDVTDLFRRLSGDPLPDRGDEAFDRATPGQPSPPSADASDDEPEIDETCPPHAARGMPEPPPANDDEPDEPEIDHEVLGGAPDERVSFAEAVANPDRYRVTRNPRRVFDRAYHDQIEGQSDTEQQPDPKGKQESLK